QQVKTYMMVSLFLILAPALFHDYVVLSALVVLPLIAFYFVWMWYLLRRLEVTRESLSFQESMVSQARAHGVVVLWLLNIASLAFVVGGIWMLVVEPSRRLVALGSVFFF